MFSSPHFCAFALCRPLGRGRLNDVESYGNNAMQGRTKLRVPISDDGLSHAMWGDRFYPVQELRFPSAAKPQPNTG